MKSWSHKRLFNFSDGVWLIVRNHWSDNFNDSFILVIDRKSQGYDVDTYRFGLFNICLVLIHHKGERK